MGGILSKKGASGFSGSSTAEEVTRGIDGTGLTAIVTGPASGIGVETSRVLAFRSVHVVMAVRNIDAGKNVKEAILQEIPDAQIDVMELDLISLASVRKFAADYTSLDLPLNILMDYGSSIQAFSGQHRTSFRNEPFRSFSAHRSFVGDHEKHIVRGKNRGEDHECIITRYQKYYAYGQSKLANILHANELTRRLKEEGADVMANSLHPGTILTNLMRYDGFLKCVLKVLGTLISKTLQQGAATTCFVALHPQLKGVGGEYFVDCNIANPSIQARDEDLAKRLWDFSSTLTNPK